MSKEKLALETELNALSDSYLQDDKLVGYLTAIANCFHGRMHQLWVLDSLPDDRQFAEKNPMHDTIDRERTETDAEAVGADGSVIDPLAYKLPSPVTSAAIFSPLGELVCFGATSLSLLDVKGPSVEGVSTGQNINDSAANTADGNAGRAKASEQTAGQTKEERAGHEEHSKVKDLVGFAYSDIIMSAMKTNSSTPDIEPNTSATDALGGPLNSSTSHTNNASVAHVGSASTIVVCRSYADWIIAQRVAREIEYEAHALGTRNSNVNRQRFDSENNPIQSLDSNDEDDDNFTFFEESSDDSTFASGKNDAEAEPGSVFSADGTTSPKSLSLMKGPSSTPSKVPFSHKTLRGIPTSAGGQIAGAESPADWAARMKQYSLPRDLETLDTQSWNAQTADVDSGKVAMYSLDDEAKESEQTSLKQDTPLFSQLTFYQAVDSIAQLLAFRYSLGPLPGIDHNDHSWCNIEKSIKLIEPLAKIDTDANIWAVRAQVCRHNAKIASEQLLYGQKTTQLSPRAACALGEAPGTNSLTESLDSLRGISQAWNLLAVSLEMLMMSEFQVQPMLSARGQNIGSSGHGIGMSSSVQHKMQTNITVDSWSRRQVGLLCCWSDSAMGRPLLRRLVSHFMSRVSVGEEVQTLATIICVMGGSDQLLKLLDVLDEHKDLEDTKTGVSLRHCNRESFERVLLAYHDNLTRWSLPMQALTIGKHVQSMKIHPRIVDTAVAAESVTEEKQAGRPDEASRSRKTNGIAIIDHNAGINGGDESVQESKGPSQLDIHSNISLTGTKSFDTLDVEVLVLCVQCSITLPGMPGASSGAGTGQGPPSAAFGRHSYSTLTLPSAHSPYAPHAAFSPITKGRTVSDASSVSNITEMADDATTEYNYDDTSTISASQMQQYGPNQTNLTQGNYPSLTRTSVNSKGMLCSACHSAVVQCAICQQTIRGIAYFCPLCGHGGHADHMRTWFERRSECAAGCGCRCGDAI
jgi:hypothetical protein